MCQDRHLCPFPNLALSLILVKYLIITVIGLTTNAMTLWINWSRIMRLMNIISRSISSYIIQKYMRLFHLLRGNLVSLLVTMNANSSSKNRTQVITIWMNQKYQLYTASYCNNISPNLFEPGISLGVVTCVNH